MSAEPKVRGRPDNRDFCLACGAKPGDATDGRRFRSVFIQFQAPGGKLIVVSIDFVTEIKIFRYQQTILLDINIRLYLIGTIPCTAMSWILILRDIY
jgi:hypothetical protein